MYALHNSCNKTAAESNDQSLITNDHHEPCVLEHTTKTGANDSEQNDNENIKPLAEDVQFVAIKLEVHSDEHEESDMTTFQIDCHNQSDSDEYFISDADADTAIQPNNDQIECGICFNIFSNKGSLRQHEITVHGTRGDHFCKRCARVFKTALEMKRHRTECILKRRNTDPQIEQITFECYLCKAPFKTKRKIQYHMKWKHGPSADKFQCDRCGLEFFAQWILNMHQNRAHLNVHKYVCSFCGKTFKTRDQFKSHMNLHTGDKTFKCTHDGCDKTFRTRSSRDSHNRIHTGYKPYQCKYNECGERFTYSIGLKRHKEYAHGIFIKKFPCNACNEIYPSKYLLKKHMTSHGSTVDAASKKKEQRKGRKKKANIF